ncbi:MAG: O-antigen ligase family protein [bacterium]|nr:O-antigen ligase family protein [bacterium]
MLGFWQFVNQRTFGFKLLGLVKHPVYEAGTSIVNAGDFGRWIRAYGAFSHPNVLGGYLIISLILTILLLSTSKNKRLITMFRVFILFDAVGIFLTFSKSAWLSLLLTLFVVYIFATSGDHKKILKAITPIAVIGLLLLVLYRPLVATRVFQKTSNEIESTTDRMQGYSESLDIIQNNALLGVGISNYTFAVRNIDKNRNIWEYQPVHNVPLLILAEIGIIGLLLLFGVFLFYIKFFGKNTSVNTLFWLFPLTPFLLFDHFFWSSYIGILLFGAFVALVAKFLTQKT